MDGLDQPSTAGAAAALPGGGRTIRHHAPRRRGRAATGWGARERGQDAAAELLLLDHNTGWDVYCVVITCPVCSRAV